MKQFVSFLLLTSILHSCTSDEVREEAIVILPETKTYPKVIVKKEARVVSLTIEKHFIDWTDSTLMTVGSYKLEKSALLQPFYASRAYRLAWWNSANLAVADSKCEPCIDELLDMIHHAHYYGLDSTWYDINQIDKLLAAIEALDSGKYDFQALVNVDLLMTNAYLLFATHLYQGVTDSISAYGLERNRLSLDLPKYLAEALDNSQIKNSLLDMQPNKSNYIWLQQALEQFFTKHKPNDIKYILPDPKEFEDACRTKAIEILCDLQYLNDTTSVIKNKVTSAIRKFQKEHGLQIDGAIGKNTVEALEKSTLERYHQIAITLEKLRWEQPWDTDRLLVNIPKYTLHLIQDDKTVKTHKIIVGNPKARTPQEINSQVEYLVTFPFWHVPKGIAANEILPHIKKDSTYLEDHHYELMGKGWTAVDPKNVDWSKMTRSNFPYRIRQKGGTWNAVGLVKFIFPNEHFVYLHDTPSKNYFNTDLRAFSHGCLRLHNPIEFADYLLTVDSNYYTVDSVQAHIDRKNCRKMRFKNPLPIYVRYYTCEADSDGNVYYFRDVYELDAVIRRLLFRNWSLHSQEVT